MQKGRLDLDYEIVYREAQIAGIEDQFEDELYSFSRLIQNNYEFKLFLEDPRISADYKKTCVRRICPAGMSSLFFANINWLIDQGREELVESLAKSVTKKLFQEKDILFGEVFSVCELNDKYRKKVSRAMEKVEGKTVNLRFNIDSQLVGGLAVRFINGEVWDISLKHRLEELKASIIE